MKVKKTEKKGSYTEFAKSMDNGNFEDYLNTVNLRNGGVHFVSGKGYGKSTALKHIARYYSKQPNTYVIIADTILNWCLSFDTCPYYTVKEDAIQEKTKNIEINDGKSYLVWAKEYLIDPEPFRFIDAMIKQNQQLILLNVELMEIDLVGTLQAKLIDFLYQKQRIKKKYHKGNLQEQYVLISEETEAVFDNSTLDRHTMSRTRKEFAEMANLRIAMFSCSQRLQEISTKFRGKMDSYLIGHTSIEDFDLKLCRMLKFSKHREDILKLPKGSWLDTKSDSIITFPDFIPKGTPYEYKPKEKPIKTQPKAEPKKSLLLRYLLFLNKFNIFGASDDKDRKLSKESSELDLYMTEPEQGNEMFPPEP
jgi:hypothetical protein